MEQSNHTTNHGELVDRTGKFGQPGDLRHALSQTDIEWVKSFIESPGGSMMLNHQSESCQAPLRAMYIWMEIQAHHAARRLLIVCPARLRKKWKHDLRERFDISSEIKDAESIAEILYGISRRESDEPFVYISSLEGLRPPTDYARNYAWDEDFGADFARIILENSSTEDFSLLDYVIIDEAHRLCDRGTANNLLGRLLSDAAKYLVLLTAERPLFEGNKIFEAMRLISPDVFNYDEMDLLRASLG